MAFAKFIGLMAAVKSLSWLIVKLCRSYRDLDR